MNPLAASRPFTTLGIAAAQGFGLRARYTPLENVPTLSDQKFLLDRYSPKRLLVQDYYARQPSGRLSWRVISSISAKTVNKAVLRNRLKRRWASAFTEALTREGYFHNGKRRRGRDGTSAAKSERAETGLTGTLEILVFLDRGIKCPHRELIGASVALIRALQRKITRMEQSGGGKQDSKEKHPAPEPAGDVSSSLMSLWRKFM